MTTKTHTSDTEPCCMKIRSQWFSNNHDNDDISAGWYTVYGHGCAMWERVCRVYSGGVLQSDANTVIQRGLV